MNLDAAIIKLMLTRENYDKYGVVYLVKTEQEIKKVLHCISTYYTEYIHHNYIALDELQGYFYLQYSSERGNKTYEMIFDQLRTLEISDSLAADVVVRYLERDTAGQMVESLMPVLRGEGGGVLLGLQDKIAEFKERALLVDADEDPFVNEGLDTLVDLLDKSGGLPWHLRACNDNLRPLTGGTLGHLFARVESGKTTFISDTVAHWVQHVGDDSVLWVANEEAGRVIKLRTYQSLLGKSSDEINALVHAGRRAELEEEYKALGGDRLHIYYDANASVEDCRSVLERLQNVRAMVIDIGDHITFKGGGDLSNPDRLGRLYRTYRGWASYYGIDILTVGQASGDADGRRDLHLDHMHNSKTDKPGALDYAIGLGKTYNESDAHKRWLTFCKNKIGVTLNETETVGIDTLKGRFYDV